VTSAQGKGYATEALRAALAWGKDHLPGDKAVCIISPENQPSLALAKKVGFSESHRSEYHQSPILVMHCPL
jgi:RimJ/RimL family protein N-acetyltransferase